MKKFTFSVFAGTLSVMSLFLTENAVSQDMHFSQFYNSPMSLNPALAGGFNGDMRGIINYKDQWKSIDPNSFRTFAGSFDYRAMQKKWKNGYLGLGLSLFNDRAGRSALTTNQVNLSVASSRTITDAHSISVGLQGGFAQKSINLNETWGDEYNSTTGLVESGTTSEPMVLNPGSWNNSFGYGDFGGGIFYNYGKAGTGAMNNQFKIKIGYAAFHVNTPNQSFYSGGDELYMKNVFHANVNYGIKNTNMSLLPDFTYVTQGPHQEILAGGRIRYTLSENSKYTGNIKESALSIGAYTRMKDAIIAVTEIEFANWAVGLSYDINAISDLRTASNGMGGMEMMIRYINPNPFRNKSSARF